VWKREREIGGKNGREGRRGVSVGGAKVERLREILVNDDLGFSKEKKVNVNSFYLLNLISVLRKKPFFCKCV